MMMASSVGGGTRGAPLGGGWEAWSGQGAAKQFFR